MQWLKDKLDKFRKSKTLIFGALLSMLGGIQALLPNIQVALTPIEYGVITFAIGVIVCVLRFYTTTALDEK